MRQFDVLVFEEDGPQFATWKPAFEDAALGWFHDSDWNRPLQGIDAEWIVFAHPSVHIDRDFLNNLAECTEGFPMVDAFAPRLKFDHHFFGGMLLDGGRVFRPISENEKMRFVAAPNPLIGVFSSRIIQRTGLFDMELPPEFRLSDYALRMAHAGGKMFSVPYLVATASEDCPAEILDGNFLSRKSSVAPLWEIAYKNLNAGLLVGFTMRHPGTLPKFLGIDGESKRRNLKRDKATALSKLSATHLKEISA